MDRRSFQDFYERTAPALRSYLRLMTGNATIADDVLQDSYLRLLRIELPELAEPALRSYLYKTARSVFIDQLRRTRHERVLEATGVEAVAAGHPALTLDLERILASLSTRERELLWFAYIEGFSHQEIAGMIDVTEKSVRVLLLRARRRMAKLLDAEGFAPGDSE